MNTEPIVIDASEDEKWLDKARSIHAQGRRARIIRLTTADAEAICELFKYRQSTSKQKPMEVGFEFSLEFFPGGSAN